MTRVRRRWFGDGPEGGAMGVVGRRVWPLVAVLGILLPSVPAEAQTPEAPTRVVRHLAVGQVSFLNTWEPGFHAGYLLQPSLRPTRISTDTFGVTTVHPPRWFAHALASVGWTTDANGRGDPGFSGLGQFGVMHRLEVDGPLTLSRVGLAAQASWAPRGFGPVVRAGFFHGNAALSVGWMRFRGPRTDGVVVTVDFLRCILQDLGLVASCGLL